MYLKSIHIKNIRGIEDFKMEFPEGKEAGWHVLLGANGSGKTTVLRAIALALIGDKEILRLNPPSWDWWVRQGTNEVSSIFFQIQNEWHLSANIRIEDQKLEATDSEGELVFKKNQQDPFFGLYGKYPISDAKSHGTNLGWINNNMEFSAGFGPYRRFFGGDESLLRVYRNNRTLGAYITLFKEDAALTETWIWLKDQLTRAYTSADEAERELAAFVLQRVKHFINTDGLLPKGYSFHEVTADGVFLKDGGGCILPLSELSEGIKSALSIGLELIHLIATKLDVIDDANGKMKRGIMGGDFIDKTGLVLIDEVDAHLHPDWQARIGTWFRKVFPNIQFIVATHSPLVVRAAGDDSQIWYLPPAGSEEKPRLIENGERNRLVFGNVLDAYGTEVFGKQAERSPDGKDLLKELAELQTDAMFGKINDDGFKRIEELRYLLQL